MWMEALSRPEDHAETCPTCGGGVQRRQYGEMHAGAYVLDGEWVDIRAVPADGYADPIWLDPLTQYFDGGLYRLWPSDRYLSRGGKTLHRTAWTAAFGPIPAGCHIHHRDSNTLNNLLANLECVPAGRHLSDAGHKRQIGVPAGQHFSATARQKAAEWHASEEGRLWHRRHALAAKSWTKWKREKRVCLQCSAEFDAVIRKNAYQQIYCTSTCKAAAYRARKAEMEPAREHRAAVAARRYESRDCATCGTRFDALVATSRPQIYCSPKCKNVAERPKGREYMAARRAREKAERDGGRVVPDGS